MKRETPLDAQIAELLRRAREDPEALRRMGRMLAEAEPKSGAVVEMVGRVFGGSEPRRDLLRALEEAERETLAGKAREFRRAWRGLGVAMAEASGLARVGDWLVERLAEALQGRREGQPLPADRPTDALPVPSEPGERGEGVSRV